MIYSIYEYSEDECLSFEDELSQFDLWWSNWQQALIRRCWLATDKNENIIGFLTKNGDGQCVAVEVLSQYRGQGIGSELVKEARCFEPETNENPSFWSKF